jgi:hypothetical protein
LHSAFDQGNYPQTSTLFSLKTHMTEFHVSYAWTKNFIKSQLDWRYCVSILAIGKLPENYELQGKPMAQ